ncbi:hypothetical protein [Streptomyces sp. NPDC008001]|uniref:hypothetical protein n=1 Tax=Streptomyces sp. NPDC008001 TaxID=3364804 RepID=UPI0036EF6BED
MNPEPPLTNPEPSLTTPEPSLRSPESSLTNPVPPLLVPVQVDALLVNKRVRDNETWRRWYADFERLDDRYAPEPDPFTSSASDKPGHGIHLQWTLPDALRRGRQDGPAGKVEFPLVPNRWLVVRHSRPAAEPGATPVAAGWIVDSDYLDYDEGTSAFLDPRAARLTPEYIGRAHDLADGPWDEPTGREPFLTAAGPGLPTFSMFQPYNQNVFSLHDPLSGLDQPSLISYLVAGWYSQEDWDILRREPGNDVRQVLDTLRWATTDSAFRPSRSLYAGTALGLSWDFDGDRPASNKPGDREDDTAIDVDVALGHIATDAETALHPAALDDPEAARLWEAFSYDLLDVLDGEDETALDQALRRTWFGAEQGGYTWRIVDRPTDDVDGPIDGVNRPADGVDRPAGHGSPRPALTPEQTAAEQQWLAELNATQAAHDAAARELAHLQRRLYGLWWLSGRPTRPGPEWDAACEAQLNPSGEGNLAHQVRDKLDELFREPGDSSSDEGGLRHRIPWGDDADRLAEAVASYAAEHGLAPGRELQRVAEPPFHSTPDPSVVVRGARLDRPLTDEKTLLCRTPGETVTRIRIGGDMIPAPDRPPAPDLSGLPEPAALDALLAEFFLLGLAALAPGSAPDRTALQDALDDDTGGHVEGVVARWTRQWRQPWSPLHLIWKMNCHPTPYRSDGRDNWRFDGTRYRWENRDSAEPPATLTGRALLNPLIPFNTRARLAQHADTRPGAPVAELRELRRRAEEWDLLSQRIDGVNDWLAQHTVATNIAPADALAELVDNRTSRVSLSEAPDPGPASGGDDRDFRPVRAAQFAFEQLHVVDRFGRSLAVISPDNAERFPVQRADSVTPVMAVNPENPYRYVELPPRLLQPARLRFDFVSATDDHDRVDVEAGPAEAAGRTPVCGWLLVNHLSRSLLVHAPDGRALGEIRVALDTAHRQITDWDALPYSPYPDVAVDTGSGRAFAAELPHLHGFVSKLLEAGPDAFAELLSSLDHSLATTAPGEDDDSLAGLAGRPVALLRARLRCELNGPAMTSSSWDDVVSPPPPEFTDYLWNVRLGAGDMLGDGLAGFYLGSDYTRLHAVPEPAPERTGYVVPIDGHEVRVPARPVLPPARAREADTAAAWVTLLADPWAAVHAVTDILPVGRLLLPSTWVREPLSRMKLAFRAGPLLAGTRPGTGDPGDPDGTPVAHLVAPGPSGWRGTWEWAEPAAGPAQWASYPLATPDPALALTDGPAAARHGFLLLSGALGEEAEAGAGTRSGSGPGVRTGAAARRTPPPTAPDEQPGSPS